MSVVCQAKIGKFCSTIKLSSSIIHHQSRSVLNDTVGQLLSYIHQTDTLYIT